MSSNICLWQQKIILFGHLLCIPCLNGNRVFLQWYLERHQRPETFKFGTQKVLRKFEYTREGTNFSNLRWWTRNQSLTHCGLRFKNADEFLPYYAHFNAHLKRTKRFNETIICAFKCIFIGLPPPFRIQSYLSSLFSGW